MKYKNYILIILLVMIISSLQATKYAGEIFKMGAGVRNFALGGCGLSDPDSPALAYWNAALLAEVYEQRFELMHAEEYMGLLKYDTFSAIWGQTDKFAVVLTRIGINDIPLTKLENEDEPVSYENRPYKYKSINNSDIVLYAGIARKIAGLNLGITPKLAYRSLAEESGFGFGADISFYHKFSDQILLGARLRDFFTTQILWGNGTHEIVNPGLDLESNYSFNIKMLNITGNLFAGIELYLENREEAAQISMGPASLDYHLGLALQPHPKWDLYFGYDIENLTTGLSLAIKDFTVNYSFEQVAELENSHRISIGLNL